MVTTKTSCNTFGVLYCHLIEPSVILTVWVDQISDRHSTRLILPLHHDHSLPLHVREKKGETDLWSDPHNVFMAEVLFSDCVTVLWSAPTVFLRTVLCSVVNFRFWASPGGDMLCLFLSLFFPLSLISHSSFWFTDTEHLYRQYLL